MDKLLVNGVVIVKGKGYPVFITCGEHPDELWEVQIEADALEDGHDAELEMPMVSYTDNDPTDAINGAVNQLIRKNGLNG